MSVCYHRFFANGDCFPALSPVNGLLGRFSAFGAGLELLADFAAKMMGTGATVIGDNNRCCLPTIVCLLLDSLIPFILP